MKKIHLFLLSFLTAMLVGCENEIPFHVNEKKPTFVMNAFIDTDSTNNRLFLNLTGLYGIQHVTNAVVEIRVNGTLAETAKRIEPETLDDLNRIPQPYYLVATRFHPGDVVRIDARTTDGKYHAWTESTVPQQAIIEQVDTATTIFASSGSAQNHQTLMRYQVTFSDRPGQRNFYRLFFELHSTLCITSDYTQRDSILYDTYQSILIREDVVLTDGQPIKDDNSMFEEAQNKYGIFDNTRIAGKRYTLTAYSQLFNRVYPFGGAPKWSSVDVTVRLQSIDETTYYYLKALNIIDSDAYDEMLMEPIRYASNVNGGIGIISFSSGTSARFHLNDDIFVSR